ncbi:MULTISPECIES: nuclear transport factor 2 family protein [unclassified Pseudoxanthomonas]|uniref:nuclear transport factor 2 family protein n=1 Tax=unclassified Pseudoxanthomonas TaxID=2645906 RepID=UPI003F505BAA
MEKAKVSMAKIGQAFIAAAALVLATLVACSAETPEAQLRHRVGGMQAAVEEKRVGDFMDGVSDDFTGPAGMDRAALHNLVRARTFANARVGTTTGPLDVRVDGDNATVSFQVLLTGSTGRLLPEQAQTYDVTTAWRREQGDWRIYHARWNAPR